MNKLAIANQSQDTSAENRMEVVSNHEEAGINTTTMKGQVIHKNYVLNDSSALKKKKRNETRKEAFNLGIEARDGSNMVVQMRTSFFEHVKSKFIEDMLNHKDIEKVENALGAKVASENSGDAFVEYSMDITFKVQDKLFVTKMTAYTTTCRVMFQPVGDASETKSMLANKSIPRYFTDVFFLPWCEAALAKNDYNEKEIMDAINDEIRRLDTLKLRKGGHRGRVSSAPTTDMKCVYRGCKYTGLNTSNKSAVGVCRKCGGYEHFECSRTKQEDRNDIMSGKQEYFCSLCFMNNPSMVAFNAKKFITMNTHTDSALKVTATTKATTTPRPLVPDIKYACSHCDLVSETQESLEIHEKDKHWFPCDVCKKVFNTESDMNDHITKKHETPRFTCPECGETFIQATELKEHTDGVHKSTISTCRVCKVDFKSEKELKDQEISCHLTKCLLCTLSFTDNEKYADHLKNDHPPECIQCNQRFATMEELEKHFEEQHSAQNNHKCQYCGNIFETSNDLDLHVLQEHTCTICKTMVKDKIELDNHMKSVHNIKCSICNFNCQDKDNLDKHMHAEHAVQCPVCTKTFRDKATFTDHFLTGHNFGCNKCGKIFPMETDLNDHTERAHTHNCTVCNVSFETKTNLETHMIELHRSSCPFCNKVLNDPAAVTEHIKITHTFECNMCDFEGASVGIMENHVIEKHFSPDENGLFSCDECAHKCSTRKELREHYIAEHGLTGDKDDSTAQEQRSLEEELRLLKNNFQRLELLFKESSEELKKVKIEYEDKLTEANDKYRSVKAENEELKEKVDVLFKLGRSYINRKEKNTDESVKNEDKVTGNIESVETITIDKDDNNSENIEDLQEWTKHKMRGFKRSNPAASPTKIQNKDPISNKKKTSTTNRGTPSTPSAPTDPAPVSSAPQALYKGRYCHYFVNQGKCTFEERTGQKCKYEHKQAPMCNFGINCTRNKCMYSHPKLPSIQNQTRNNFLGQVLNPFTIMNPWMSPPQNPWNMPNPWRIQGNQNTRQ